MFGKMFGRKPAQSGGSPPGPPVLPTQFAALQEMAMNHTGALMSAHDGLWKISQAANWAVDFGVPEIRWTFADGKVAVAPVQLIGTWNSGDDTFLWGWDHPSATPATSVAAKAVKAFADQHAIGELQVRSPSCDFEGGWRLAAIAVLVADLQGIYRGQASDTAWAYLGFGTISLSKD